MQNNKKQGTYTIPWLLLSVLAKMNVRENAGWILRLSQVEILAGLIYIVGSLFKAVSKGKKLG